MADKPEESRIDLTKIAQPPTAEEVTRLHTYADTDSRAEAIHHTLGPGKWQASPGDHDHKGGNGRPLFAGYTMTGSRTSGTAVLSIAQILAAFGAVDNTSP